MKKLKKGTALLLTVLMLLGVAVMALPAGAAAGTFQNKDFLCTLNDDNTITIDRYIGEGGNVNIPSHIDGVPVVEIGERAFYKCANLSGVTIAEGVKTIGNYAFADCDNLSNLTIAEGTRKIGDYAFSEIKIKTLTLPKGVEEIGDRAFYYCTSLSSVTFGEGVKKIGDYAFYSTRMKSLSLPEGLEYIGSNVFNNNGLLETVYVPPSVKYIGSNTFYQSPFMNGLRENNEFVILGDGVLVAYTGNSKNIQVPHGVKLISDAFHHNTIEHISIPNTVHTIGDHAFYYCKIKSITLPDSVHTIGKNAFPDCVFEQPIKLSNNLRTIGESAFLRSSMASIELPDSLEEIGNGAFFLCNLTGIEIPKNVKSIGSSAFSYMSNLKKIVIPRGVESIGYSVFFHTSNVTIYGYTYSVAEVYAKKQYIPFVPIGQEKKPELTFKANDICFTVPEDVPLIGGGDIDIDLGNTVPVNITIKKDTIRASIGEGLKCETDVDWANLKRDINGASRRLPNTGTPKLFGTTVNASIAGYAEAVFEGSNLGDIKTLSGKVALNLSADFTIKKDVMVVVVPVVIKLSVSAGIETTASIGYNFNKSQLYMEGETEITLPKVKTSAGTGVSFLSDVSVYGQLTNTVTFKNPQNSLKASLSGEVGASATVLSYTYSVALLESDDWVYYDSSARKVAKTAKSTPNTVASLLDSANYTINRSYLNKQSDWVGAQPTSSDAVSTATLQKDIYSSAAPKLVTTPNGTTMMVWTTDIASRTDGNHLATVFSLYNSQTDTWSAPQMVADDGTSDFYPDVTNAGNAIYVTWTNAKKTFGSNARPEEVASACEISVAKFNVDNGSFDPAITITNNEKADISPKIADINGTPYLVWLRNHNNDVLMQSGTNSLHYANLSDMANVKETTYVSVDKPIVSADIGLLENTAHIVYALDTDANLATSKDIELYSSAISTSPVRITNNDTLEQNPQFANINGTDTLLWYCDNNFHQTTDLNTISPILKEEDNTAGPNFTVLSSNGNTAIVYTADSKEEGTDVYTLLYTDGAWYSAVPITNTEGYVNYPNGFFDQNGNINITYTRTDAQINENGVTESTDLCVSTIPKAHNLTVNCIVFEDAKVKPNGTLPLDISVTNNGLLNTETMDIIVQKDNSEYYRTTISKDLTIGSTDTIQVNMPLPASITKAEEYTVQVVPTNAADSDLSDNTYQIALGYTDLSVQVEDQDGAKDTLNAKVTVKNNSCVPTNATLNIRKETCDGEILGTYSLGSIPANQTKLHTVTEATLRSIAKDGDVLYFEVVSDAKEVFTGDNNDFLVADFPYILGDVNNDGKIDLYDVMILRQYVAGYTTLTDKQKRAADVDRDKILTSEDHYLIQLYYSRVISEF